ncbi:MAG: class I tRNA ligase family protein [Thaumarchaeota archaeon]|nr:class I tRNA ligase family protein [Nitrososphaerota archaeon]
MSGRKEPFLPRDPPHVKMFVCGPTVQSQAHLGHARTYIFYDALARYLGYLGYDVFYLMNITDIDETITRAARKAGEDPLGYSERMTASFLDDLKLLNVATVTHFEPVSRHVGEMIAQVESLLDRGFAYEAGGWVYYDTTKFRRWGRLSHQSKQDLTLRPLELSPRKRSLNDFALWRPETLVAGRWRSPWGQGSPGWHIQDTAVTIPILGPQYDIHGGAYDLVYPHHEAEIAQGETLTGARPMVRYWVHAGLLHMEGQKMSKSLGNIVAIRDALRFCTADELRFCFLSIHYRKEADLSGFVAARRRLAALRKVAKRFGGPDGGDEQPLARFERALNDDFDSPRALDWVEATLKAAAKAGDQEKAKDLAWSTVRAMRILGVDLLGSS